VSQIDPYGAFLDYPFVVQPCGHDGLLRRTTFGVKDIFDVAGYRTGCGHPLKLEQSPIASRSARCVELLLDSGAVFLGKTHTDEFAYSLNGENFHYGTPINPAAPERIPGGSSSGSAVAVAGRLSDFAIGSDTGGSVRIPASYCGIWGIRSTHGAISVEGVMPFAPSFDVVGWFARNGALLRDVGRCLLPAKNPAPITRLIVIRDAVALVAEEISAPVFNVVAQLREHLAVVDIEMAPEGLDAWANVFRIHQGYEVWQSLGAWISANEPQFGPGIKERFAWASTISKDQFDAAARSRAEIRRRVLDVVGDNATLILPTAPGIAPLRGSSPEQLDDFRNRALQLLCIAGLSGTPQISIPGQLASGYSIGISIVGPLGGDLALLDLCNGLADVTKPWADQGP
jgi:amidase